MTLHELEHEFAVDVALGRGAEHIGADELELELLPLLAALVTDVALPRATSPRLSIADHRLTTPEPFRVTVDGERARVPLTTVNFADPAAAARTVAWALFRERGALVSRAFAQSLWRSLVAHGRIPGPSAVSGADRLRAVVTALVESAYAVDRGLDPLLDALAEPQARLPEAFEAALQGAGERRVRVLLGAKLAEHLLGERAEELRAQEQLMRDGLFYELGVWFPEASFEQDPMSAPSDFRIAVNDVASPPFIGIAPGELLLNDTPDRLRLFGLAARRAINPANWSEAAVVAERPGTAELVREGGLVSWTPLELVVFGLAVVLRREAHTFVTGVHIELALGRLEEVAPEAVEAALVRFSIPELAWVVRRLVAGRLGLRHLQTVCEALADAPERVDRGLGGGGQRAAPTTWASDFDVDGFESWVRLALPPALVAAHARDGRVTAVLLDEALEERLAEAKERPLDEDERDRLLAATLEAVSGEPTTPRALALVTRAETRTTLRRLVGPELPEVGILSYAELGSDVPVHPVARLAWA